MKKNTRKLINLLTGSIMLFGITLVPNVIYADSLGYSTIGGDTPYEHAPALRERFGTSGRMTTRVNRNTYFLGGRQLAEMAVGTLTTQAWWEVDERLNMRGFGGQQMNVARGPQHLVHWNPEVRIFVSRMPHPTVAWWGVQGTFMTPFQNHIILHEYHMYTRGVYSFRNNQ